MPRASTVQRSADPRVGVGPSGSFAWPGVHPLESFSESSWNSLDQTLSVSSHLWGQEP